ncbi:ShlB/FhaC/HecB family hemolysin secretion/activation protein [soil metagenome]
MKNNNVRQAQLKPLLLSLSQAAIVLASLPASVAFAQTVVPGAGQIIQQVPQPATPTPSRPGVTIQQPAPAPAASSAPFMVRTIEITGNTVFPTATLKPLVAEGEGKTITLAQLDALALRITEYYRTRGYPLTRAIIPAQTLTAGTVRLQVLETKYGQVRLENSTKVSDATLTSTLSPLQAGQLLSQDSLDRALLLLSDYPGVAVNATLSPGSAVGTTDLNIRTVPSNAPIGNVYMDSYGSKYTGRVRLGANLDLNNLLGRGDVLSLSGLTSTHNLAYARLGYQIPVNGNGTRVGAALSALEYRLGDSLKPLGANGKATIASLWASHPVIRSIDRNLYVRFGYDHKEFQDRIDTTGLNNERDTDAVTLEASADQRDSVFNGGITTASVSATAGRLKFKNAAAEAADTATANTRGSYSKFNAAIARTQAITPSSTVYVGLSGQYTKDNLDSSEQVVMGGPGSVRGYGVGTLSGGSGYLVTAEFRQRLSLFPSSGTWQAIAFVDSGHVKINANQWVAGPNTATLSGAGVGLNWAGYEGWTAKFDIAAPFGSTPTLVGTRDKHWGWVQVGKSF